jgi:glutamine synthetase
VSGGELVTLACCDLGAIVRGRAIFASELGEHLERGVGWVPANHALTPLGPLADPSPFGSTGDLRLLPDPDAHMRVPPAGDAAALEVLLCDIVEIDGSAWECCPREVLRRTLEELERELGVDARASFEHEFQLLSDEPTALPFSLEAQRRVEPFPARTMACLAEAGLEPERFFAEYAPHQFEIPVGAAAALTAADRAVLLREVVREVARQAGTRASFVPLLDPDEAGNGVHVHIGLSHASGGSALYDASRAGGLSELGGRFAAGILLHAAALVALTAASPISPARLRPHRWSAGAVCLAERNREALLRIPPLVTLGGGDPESQMRLEYRAADASANPHLALGAILHAGLDGVRRKLDPAPVLDRDPSLLTGADAERFGVDALPASLDDALAALADDEVLREWLAPLLFDAYTSVKRAELDAVAELDLATTCRRYAHVY